MHVVFVTVDIKPGRFDDANETLNTFVVPTSSQSPGFVRGTWWNTSDETTGHGLVLFDNEENARAMAQQAIDVPADAPVSIRSVEVGPVSAEA